jgi:hypothetical protein
LTVNVNHVCVCCRDKIFLTVNVNHKHFCSDKKLLSHIYLIIC